MRRVVAIKPAQLGQLEKRLGPALKHAQMQALRNAGKEMVITLKGRAAWVRDTGFYGRAWEHSTPNPDLLRIENTCPWAVFVENGRRPGAKMPPIKAIMPWVLRHFGDPDMAWPVAVKIARDGIEPRPVLAQTHPALERIFHYWIQQCWADALKRAVP